MKLIDSYKYHSTLTTRKAIHIISNEPESESQHLNATFCGINITVLSNFSN